MAATSFGPVGPMGPNTNVVASGCTVFTQIREAVVGVVITG